jgi:hypothetical protein
MLDRCILTLLLREHHSCRVETSGTESRVCRVGLTDFGAGTLREGEASLRPWGCRPRPFRAGRLRRRILRDGYGNYSRVTHLVFRS